MTRRRWLHLGEGLKLPLDVISRRTAILGQTDTGKTSTAVVMVEEAEACGASFVIIDPTDAWWGIASSGDGDGPGLNCVVIGGPHGDVPIDEHAGRIVARLVIDEGYNVVLCLKSLGSWAARQRFVADFLSELYEHCARQVLLVVDEAHRFAPQRAADANGHAARCMGAMIDVVLLGRRQGIGTVVVTQRTARLHKDVLEASEVLIAHRLRGKNDREALKAWVDEAGVDVRDIMDAVGRAPKGVAYVSAPTLDVGGTFTIRPKRTFDSSKTIELGDVAVEPKARATVDMAALERHLADTIERQKAEDPAELRKRVADLEQQLSVAEAEGGHADLAELAIHIGLGDAASGEDIVAAALDEIRTGQEAANDLEQQQGETCVRQGELDDIAERLRRSGYDTPVDAPHRAVLEAVEHALGAKDALRGFQNATRLLWTQEGAAVRRLVEGMADLDGRTLASFKPDDGGHVTAPSDEKGVQSTAAPTDPAAGDEKRDQRSNGGASAPSSPPTGRGGSAQDAAGARSSSKPAASQPCSEGGIVAGAWRQLEALARYGPLTRADLEPLGCSYGGAGRRNLGALRDAGLITEDGGYVGATPAGLGHFADVQGKRWTTDEVLARIEQHSRKKLVAGARRILGVLLRAPDQGFTRAELERLGDSRGGAFRRNLGSLKAKGIITERNRRVYPADVLYADRVER